MSPHSMRRSSGWSNFDRFAPDCRGELAIPTPAPIALRAFIDCLTAAGLDVERRDTSYRAQCPGASHNRYDQGQALSVSYLNFHQGGGKVIARCWSHNCTEKEILDALDLAHADLFDDAPRRKAAVR